MKIVKGFTLSEILIAMLVLGIIVAASVPVILNLTPNKNAIMMKKAYYATESIIHSLINDPNYYPDQSANCNGTASWSGTDGCYYGFDDTTSVTLLGNITTTSATKLQCLFASKLNIKEDLAAVCNGSKTIVNTMDGMTWDLTGLVGGTNSNYLRVDVDGEDKGINKFFVNSMTCDTIYSWNGAAACGDAGKKTKKKFDRINITISPEGKLSIPEKQEEFIKVLSGERKLMGDDDEK